MSLFAEPNIEASTGTPSASALEAGSSLLPPKEANFCLGHEKIESHLLTLINNNKLPHGLIFSGIKGIGKSTLAFRLAKFLLSLPAEDSNQGGMFDDLPAADPTSLNSAADNAQVKLFLAGAHPDCIVAERNYDEAKKKYKDQIDIAEIRKIEPFLRMTSSNGGWRVVIIDDADTMNRNAQNALLKILEEPPKKTLIILIAHRFGSLIPTIKSRTQHIHFNPLSTGNIQALQNKAELPSLSPTLIQMAEGSFGRSQQLAEEEGEETLQSILVLLKSCPTIDWPTIHKKTAAISKAGQDQSYKMFHRILTGLLWLLTQQKARGHRLPRDLETNAGINNILQNNSLQSLMQKHDQLIQLFNRTNFANLDKKTALLQAISLITT